MESVKPAQVPDTISVNEGTVERVGEQKGGETQDDIDLIELTGHKPVLERNYSRFALLALSFMIVDSFMGILGSLAAGISSGGTALLIYGSIGVGFFSLAVALSLAELASAYPTSGGQYHWTAELAPKGYGPVLSWFCGYFNTFGWCVVSASIMVILGQFLMAMVILANPGITYYNWQGFIVYQILNVLCTIVNIFGQKWLPYLHRASFMVFVVCFLAVNMTLLGTAFPKNSASFVFSTFTNTTGWASNGIAFIVGLTSPAFAFGGIDGAIHMAEEMKDARRNLPLVIIGTIVIGFVSLFITIIIVCFCIIDLDAVLSTATNVPILEIFYQATQSVGASNFLLCIMLYLNLVSVIASMQTANRLIWAFARDNALPFSKTLSVVDPKRKVPVRAALLCWAVVAVLGCIYLGSTTAFNALVGCNVLLADISFAFPFVLLLLGRRRVMKPSLFPLGNVLGPIINAIALGWILFMVVFFDFPFVYPVTPDNMNYSCLVIGAVGIFSAVYWFAHGNKTYKGPKMDGMEAAFQTEVARGEAQAAKKEEK